jgi:hypothetical protein
MSPGDSHEDSADEGFQNRKKNKKKAAVSRMLPRAPGPRSAFAATQTGPHSSMGNIQDIDAYGMHSSQY